MLRGRAAQLPATSVAVSLSSEVAQPDSAIGISSSVLGQPVGGRLERRPFEPRGPSLRLAAAADQAGPLEHPQILGVGSAHGIVPA